MLVLVYDLLASSIPETPPAVRRNKQNNALIYHCRANMWRQPIPVLVFGVLWEKMPADNKRKQERTHTQSPIFVQTTNVAKWLHKTMVNEKTIRYANATENSIFYHFSCFCFFFLFVSFPPPANGILSLGEGRREGQTANDPSHNLTATRAHGRSTQGQWNTTKWHAKRSNQQPDNQPASQPNETGVKPPERQRSKTANEHHSMTSP